MVDGLHAVGEQPVAPVPQLSNRQHRNRLGQQRRRQVMARLASRWSRVAPRTARSVGVVGQRLVDRRRPSGVGVLTARQCLRLVGGLPEVEDVRAVRVLLIVGDAKALDPVAALAIGGADVPRAGTGVAAIAQAMPGATAIQYGLRACASFRRAVRVSS